MQQRLFIAVVTLYKVSKYRKSRCFTLKKKIKYIFVISDLKTITFVPVDFYRCFNGALKKLPPLSNNIVETTTLQQHPSKNTQATIP